ncbi:hypothetical protein CTI12_AA181840 [Artemisia annua]|uniref:Uncharacterized protein n=1 Tax=Artemisia annua TaxID=35608 RepID=A0A2U1P8F2_ARTAN|nr:hypothetical protein CTI12_AA181840 [Artemisia annua]
MTAANDPTTQPPMTIIQRRNTTAGTSASSSLSDFELVSIKPSSYTSLRDILPSPKNFVQSPKAPSYVAHSRYEILIRNRLVKEAAWAYLQPMSNSPEADGSSVLHRLWTQVSSAFVRVVSAAFDCLLLSDRVGT